MIALNSKQEITEERIRELGVISRQDIQNKAQTEKIMNEEETISEKNNGSKFPNYEERCKITAGQFLF